MPRVRTGRPYREVHLAALADEVAAKVGRPSAVRMSLDENGHAVVEVVFDEQPRTPDGDPVELDEAALLELVDSTPPPRPRRDPLDELAEKLDKATTVAALRSALSAYVEAERSRRPHPASLPRSEERSGRDEDPHPPDSRLSLPAGGANEGAPDRDTGEHLGARADDLSAP